MTSSLESPRWRRAVWGATLLMTLFVASSTPSSAATSKGLPAPVSVRAQAGHFFATVHWNAPTSTGAQSLTRYVVFSRPDARRCVTRADTHVCSIWELRDGVRYTFSVTALYPKGASPRSVPSNAVTPSAKSSLKPTCGDGVIATRAPVAGDVLNAVRAYYAAKNLGPISMVFNYETILNVHEQFVGIHYCLNSGGGLSGCTGAVPAKVTAAVEVYVKHKPYPVVGASQNFVTLAKLPARGWKVVGEGTGP